jgi:hypothetical protein
MQASRSSAIAATPLLRIVCFIIVVAKASKPGTIDCMALGMFQRIERNQSGPKGIFIGIAGLPSGLTCRCDRSFFSSSSP